MATLGWLKPMFPRSTRICNNEHNKKSELMRIRHTTASV